MPKHSFLGAKIATNVSKIGPKSIKMRSLAPLRPRVRKSIENNEDFVVINNSTNSVDIIHKIKPDFYCKGPDYKDFKKDITGQIKNEQLAVKRNGGKIIYTSDLIYSSSSIINQVGGIYDLPQKNFIKKIKSETNLNNFDQQFKKLKDLKVLVLGETIIDKYVFCEALGKSGKEPHLVLRDLKEEVYLGGVIAISRNISNFCKKVGILSMLGHDKKYEQYIRKNLSKNEN